MSKSGLIGRFGDKEAMQRAVLAEAVERFTDAVWRPAARAEPGLPRLEAIVDAWIAHLRDGVFPGGCFVTTASVEYDARPGPLHDDVAAAVRRWLGVLEAEARTRARRRRPARRPRARGRRVRAPQPRVGRQRGGPARRRRDRARPHPRGDAPRDRALVHPRVTRVLLPVDTRQSVRLTSSSLGPMQKLALNPWPDRSPTPALVVGRRSSPRRRPVVAADDSSASARGRRCGSSAPLILAGSRRGVVRLLSTPVAADGRKRSASETAPMFPCIGLLEHQGSTA